MNYVGLPGDEFIGTGWLISSTLIATAGHCGVEDGKALKYINIYFGYNGTGSESKPGVTRRYGTKIAIPAEYLKASVAAHDVSFVSLKSESFCPSLTFKIVLNEPVTNIKPIKYVSTPITKVQPRMGVVGFPGDLDYGQFMYEEWIAADID